MSRGLIALFALSTAFAGCVSPKSSDDDDDTGSEGASGSGVVYDINQGNIEPGELVTLEDVIVTSPLTRDGAGFFVQAETGGPYSGMYIYLQGTFTDLYLSVGDRIDISGEVVEFYGLWELTVSSPESIQVTGTGEVYPEVLSDVEDWNQWESVLVELQNQEVLECTNQYGESAITEGIEIDDLLYIYDTERGAVYDGVVGVITYSYEEYKLLPRDENDFIGYTAGEGCTVSVFDIQTEGIEGGIELTEVVVTGGPTTDGGYFVQDAGGGEYTGIYLYAYDDVDMSLEVGDVVNIKGTAVEYYDFTEVSISATEDIEVVGTGTPVATEISSVPTDWEPYESVLVTWTNVEITAEADYGESETNYGVNIDDWLHAETLLAGQTFDGITGLMSYSFEEFKLCPRSSDDFGGGTTVDPTETTVYDIQKNGVTGLLQLDGLIVTSPPTYDGTTFYVQDAGGGEYAGVAVFMEDGAPELSVGDEISITGGVTEFYDLTELIPTEVTVTGTGSVTVATLSSAPSDYEAYEGVLVELTGLSLTEDANEYGTAQTSWADLYMEDDFHAYQDTYGSGDAFSSVTGIWGYSYSDFKILPRDASDLIAD